jgi:hypothetical protein
MHVSKSEDDEVARGQRCRDSGSGAVSQNGTLSAGQRDDIGPRNCERLVILTE